MPNMRTDNPLKEVRVIGFGGLAGAGKDTVANILSEHLEAEHGKEVVILGMSDTLRKSIYRVNPWILLEGEFIEYRDILVHLVAVKGMTEDEAYTEAKTIPGVRTFLQRLGTDVGRELIDQNVWVNIVKKEIEKHLATPNKVIFVTGVRFPNEIEMIHSFKDSSTMYISRTQWQKYEETATHVSEKSLEEENFKIKIQNNGTLEELKDKVLEML